MRVLIFGTGYVYEQNRYRLNCFDIVAFLDNDVNKIGCMLEGIYIDSPKNYDKYQFDAIIIMSIYYEEMRKQLIDLGVKSGCIIDVEHRGPFDNCFIKEEYRIFEEVNANHRVLLVSNELSNTGAPNALKTVAQVLCKHGFKVDLITCKKGKLLYDLISLGVNVTVYDRESMIPDDFYLQYDFVFLNTIMVYGIAKRLAGKSIPVLWWIHEDEGSFLEFGIQNEYIVVDKNIVPLGVSNRVIDAYKKYTGKENIQRLCCAINEYEIGIAEKQKTANDKKIVCAIIGYVNDVKNQKLLTKALDIKKDSWEDNLEFWIIGKISNKDREYFQGYHSIKVWGEVNHETLMEMYQDIDIVLCTSKYESLSISIIEAMMQKKICVVSSNTGIAEYCRTKENSIVYQSEDFYGLCDAIDWLLSNQNQWKSIADNGYETYKANFSLRNFEDRLIDIINACLGK